MYRAFLNRCWTSSTESNMGLLDEIVIERPFIVAAGNAIAGRGCRPSMSRARAVYNRRMRTRAAVKTDSARYHRLQLLLRISRLALGAAYLAALVFGGGGAALAAFAARLTGSAPGQVALVAVALGA